VDQKKNWPLICRAVGRPDLIDDARFNPMEVRLQNMEELIAIFDEAFAQHDMEYWTKTLDEHDIPYSCIASAEEAGEDPQMMANDVFVEVDHPKFGRFHTVNSPMELQGVDKVNPDPAPEMGQHTEALLAGLGYSDEEIQSLFACGAAVQKKDT